ncbi:tail fiber protein [Winogradskyella litorisediminis]|uniref:Tail fiber protein n=1 Tax=Winogradskyella litorisediminis TaxID=1156618 RepID=A0ABW3N731_9FLAO
MKTRKLLSLLTIGLISLSVYSQISGPITVATTSGIAIQGIARNGDNTAIVSQNVDLRFEVYYGQAPAEQVFVLEEPSLLTDEFGVFSYVLNLDDDDQVILANFESSLRITRINSGVETIVSNEPFKSVPYATAAGNGVPTGSIMPFMGTKANLPKGWAFCDGTATDLTSIPGSERLIALLGSNNPPDLRGMFLRGAGTNGLTTQVTTLGGVQDDTYLSHSHGNNFSINNTFGNDFTIKWVETTAGFSGGEANGSPSRIVSQNSVFPNFTNSISYDMDHNHGISGGVSANGSNESRPVNYGVNYIIKL